MPKIHNQAGRLTAYGLACGYIETHNHGHIETTLWHEGACYHVRQMDWQDHRRLVWDSFYTLAEARCRFSELTTQ